MKRLHPPDNEAAESWAARYDRAYAILPVQPTDDDKQLVVVLCDDTAGEPFTEAFLVEGGEDIEWLLDAEKCPHRGLYFHIPRAIIERPGICPELGA